MDPLSSHLAWNEIHPVVVHFPVALLLVAPVFVLLGVLQSNTRGRTLQFAALLLMSAGTIGAFVAHASGSAAARGALATADARQLLGTHRELAEITLIVYSVLTVAFTATLGTIWHRNMVYNRILQKVVPLVFLVFYGAGILILLTTAHMGERLTHEYGVNLPGPAKSRVASAQSRTDSGQN